MSISIDSATTAKTTSAEIQTLLQTQSDKIFYLWFAIIIITILALTFLTLWLIKRYNKTYLSVGIRVSGNKIKWHKLKRSESKIEIDHGTDSNGKKDIFVYIIDLACINYADNGKAYIEFYYRNPHPIKFDPLFDGYPVKVGEQKDDKTGQVEDIIEYHGRNRATIKEQNLDVFLKSDAIQKFVLAKAILTTVTTMLIIIMILISVNIIASGYSGYVSSDKTCILQTDNSTLNTIYIGTHMQRQLVQTQPETQTQPRQPQR